MLKYQRVASLAEVAAEDTSQAAQRATIHDMTEGEALTTCGRLTSEQVKLMGRHRAVSCQDCLTVLRAAHQVAGRTADEIAEAKQRQVERDAESFRKLRECCGYVENGSEQTVRIFQDDATRGWIVKCGDERLVSSVPPKYSKPRSYHAGSLNEAIDMAYIVEKQEF